MESEDEILFEERGAIGLVTMNRPRALNALTLDMIRLLDSRLRRWEDREGVGAVVIRGAGDKAFCAGGDILHIYNGRTDGHNPFGETFFPEEYRLNRRIKRYPKPYIALIDGIVMGGGVGVSLHGSHRLVTENTVFAMPETGIGLYPDVGATYFLPRLPGRLGLFLGLTGWRLKAADCLYAGLATHFVERERLEALTETLAAGNGKTLGNADVDGILADFSGDPGPSGLESLRDGIDRCFAGESVEEIIEALGREPDDWARKARSMMERASPTSLRMTFRQLHLGSRLEFEDCMRLENRLSLACLTGADFYEGIRAVIVEKDQSPKWRPPSLAEVPSEALDKAFASLGDAELRFD
jgi:enoyl-CoA hydratase